MCQVSRSVAFTVRPRIAAGESLLALPMELTSWLRLLRRKCKDQTADPAARKSRHSRNGGLSPFCQFARAPLRFEMAAKAADRAHRTHACSCPFQSQAA